MHNKEIKHLIGLASGKLDLSLLREHLVEPDLRGSYERQGGYNADADWDDTPWLYPDGDEPDGDEPDDDGFHDARDYDTAAWASSDWSTGSWADAEPWADADDARSVRTRSWRPLRRPRARPTPLWKPRI